MDQIFDFSYAFQPIININSKTIFSVEALIRSKNNESIGFIFEQVESDKLFELDQIARNKAIKMAASLHLSTALNLNFLPASLTSPYYLEQTLIAFKNEHLRADQLIIEITEAQAVNEPESLIVNLADCRRQGSKIAIDDFGAGYAGLNLLAEFQPDFIKLDMKLIRNIDKHGPRQAIVQAIIQVCFSLGIEVIAEGVETLAEFSWLKKHDIELFQGYLFAKPGFECIPPVHYPL